MTETMRSPGGIDRFIYAKDRVKQATDIVALIGEYLELHPRGRAFTALCPFHEERTRSFTVFPETQHFHCYGCDKGGDVFSFLMFKEGMSFLVAFRTLGRMAGLDIHELMREAT